MEFELSESDMECVLDCLERELQKLRQEEGRTDSLEYKEQLYLKDDHITQIVDRLRSQIKSTTFEV